MSLDTSSSAERFKDEPVLTENANTVLRARYLKKNEAGECMESPRDLFRRVARTIADIELTYGGTAHDRQRWEDRFYGLMTSLKFMPNSPTLMNAGREMGMLSACFVLPVRDSIVEIFNSIKHTALIQKAGGGTGFAFDELRPTGDFIKSSGGTTSGPISFWRAFSEATNAIQQGAFRRGANMGMMYIHHPDILKFLHAKQDLNQFTNYNISVKVTDVWMDEFLADPDSPHVTRNPRTGRAYVLPRELEIWKYDLRDLPEIQCVAPLGPDTRKAYFSTPQLAGELPAELRGRVYTKRDIWDIIIKNAWQTGEPGVVFIDRINEHNPTPHVGRIEATNPCGEQPLLPYEACNLGSVNLGVFVRNAFTPQAEVDWEALREAVHESVRFLDNVIDANNYPLPEIDAVCKGNRKIGLGIMGFADALFGLNIAYNSDEGVAWGERFMRFVNDEAHAASEELARQRGCFPNWKGSIWQVQHSRMMRNAAVTTVAPTGTISIIANCSGGVEPLFSLAFLRNVLRGQKQGDRPLVEVNEAFRAVAARRGFLSDALLERLATEGTLAHIDEIPADVQRVFVCAHDIVPEWHMRMQAAFQRHCDSSISKTINFPRTALVPDVEKIYQLAYELGCKGVTVYRDGCRECQPMALKNNASDSASAAADSVPQCETEVSRPAQAVNESAASSPAGAGSPPPAGPAHASPPPHESRPSARPRTTRPSRPNSGGSADPCGCAVAAPPYLEPADLPEIVSGFRIRQMTPFGNMHVKITVDPRTQRELEIFAQLGKGGDVANSDLEGLCRIASLWLRAGGSLRHLIKQWEGIGSSLQIPTRAGRIMSLPDGLACALKKYARAKERFGLRALLLGEIDLADLDNPAPQAESVTDRSIAAADPASAPLPPGRGAPAHLPEHETPAGDGGNGHGDAIRRPPRRNRLAEEGPSLWGRGTETAVAPAPTGATAVACDEAPPRPRGKLRRAANGNGNGHGATDQELTVADPSGAPVTELASRPVRAPAAGLTLQAAPAPSVMPSLRERSAALTALLGTVRHHHDAAAHYSLRCPACGGTVARQEGCLHCANHCGWAAC